MLLLLKNSPPGIVLSAKYNRQGFDSSSLATTINDGYDIKRRSEHATVAHRRQSDGSKAATIFNDNRYDIFNQVHRLSRLILSISKFQVSASYLTK